MPTIEYQTPNMIDGDPQEVRAVLVDQLVIVAEGVEALACQSEIMLRNSHMSRILRAAPAATPEELTEEWETSDEAGRAARIVGAAQTLRKITAQLKGPDAPGTD